MFAARGQVFFHHLYIIWYTNATLAIIAIQWNHVFPLYYDPGNLAQKRAVVEKRVEKKPRNSTAQFVRRLNWFVGLYKGTDLRFYVNEGDLVKFQVMGAVQTGEIAGQVTQDAIRAYGAQPAPAL